MTLNTFHRFLLVNLLICMLVLSEVNALGQNSDSLITMGSDLIIGEIINGDTIYYSTIEEIFVYAEPTFERRRDLRKYRRLVRNVKKAYPYAKIAGKKLEEVNAVMLEMKTESERKKYMKQVEQELLDEFEDDLKKLTITQGRILLKLIDRETGDTSYELVKELRGTFSAVFWQALARLFGSNLKSEYDAQGEDQMIEQIILMIENGQL